MDPKLFASKTFDYLIIGTNFKMYWLQQLLTRMLDLGGGTAGLTVASRYFVSPTLSELSDPE